MGQGTISELSLPFPVAVTIIRVDPIFYLTPLLSKPRFQRARRNVERNQKRTGGRRLISRERIARRD